MSRYDKIPLKKPDSLISLLWAVVQFFLLLCGLIGLSVQLFREKGWLHQALRGLMNAESTTLVVTLPVALLVFLAVKSWLTSQDREKSSLAADAMLYVMMAVGAWFIYSYLANGDI